MEKVGSETVLGKCYRFVNREMLKNFGVQADVRCSSLTRQHGVHVNISSDVAKIQHQAIVNKVHAEPDDIEH